MRFFKPHVTKKRIIVVIILIVLYFMWLNNTNLFVSNGDSGFRFLAHRGLAQVFNEAEADWDSNTAAMIDEPTHDFIKMQITE